MWRNNPSTDPLWFWFGISSIVFLAVLAVSPAKDFFREYRSYQQDHRQLLLERAGSPRELEQARATGVGIRQIWIPELDNRVDRCVTCHLGIDDPRLADVTQPHRSHPPVPHVPEDLDSFGCVVCHQGQGRATTVAAAHGEAADWESPLLPLGYTEAGCGRCHEDASVPEASMLSAGRALVEQAGCYGCHELRGHSSWQSDAPDLDGLSQKTHVEWLRAWLKDPKALQPGTWMPDFDMPDDEIDALVAFLWAQPPTAEQVVEENRNEPGDYDRGRRIFRESRCITCHLVEGKGNGSAPELSGIASKVNRDWLIAFLRDPHAFQPDTVMPRYAFEHQDLLDLSQYMMEEFIDPSAPTSAGQPYRTALREIERGETVYSKYGCGGCHGLKGQAEGPRIGPELTGIGDKPVGLLDFGQRTDLPRALPDWLAAKLLDPRSFRPGLKMPAFDFTPEEVQAVVTALLAASSSLQPNAYRVAATQSEYTPPGRFGRIVKRYRCQSCHLIQGAGTDIATAPLTYEGSRVKPQWLEDYMLVPTTIRPLLAERMVPLRMPREEAAFIADFIQNVYVDDAIPDDLFPDGPPSERAERGRALFHERYGCQACHMVDNHGGYYGPLMDGLGDRLKPGWVAWWLQGPQRWREDVRCPDHGMSATDAEDLAAYVASISVPRSSDEGVR